MNETPPPRFLWAIVLTAILMARPVLMHRGRYGITLFIMLPALLGCAFISAVPRDTARQAAGLGAAFTVLASFA